LSFRIGIPWSGCEYKSDIPVTSEQEAVAIACGMQLGGAKTFVFMQDSGWLNCINNMCSLVYPYGFKIGGEVKGVPEPEHHKRSYDLYRYLNDTI